MKKWTTGEIAKQRNISVRTLRYYDQINLLKPSYKDEHGKRYYSEEDLFKLEKILILKSLSLPLKDIREVLEKLSYKQILISHYNFLQEQLIELKTSIAHTASLLNMMELDETLSWERVSELVRHAQKAPTKKWMDYFNKAEQEILEETVPSLSQNNELTMKYILLLRRMERCMNEQIKPESKEGYQIGEELIALTDESFRGDTKLMDKFREVRKLPAEETGLYPISEEVLNFAERCIAYAEQKNR